MQRAEVTPIRRLQDPEDGKMGGPIIMCSYRHQSP